MNYHIQSTHIELTQKTHIHSNLGNIKLFISTCKT